MAERLGDIEALTQRSDQLRGLGHRRRSSLTTSVRELQLKKHQIRQIESRQRSARQLVSALGAGAGGRQAELKRQKSAQMAQLYRSGGDAARSLAPLFATTDKARGPAHLHAQPVPKSPAMASRHAFRGKQPGSLSFLSQRANSFAHGACFTRRKQLLVAQGAHGGHPSFIVPRIDLTGVVPNLPTEPSVLEPEQKCVFVQSR